MGLLLNTPSTASWNAVGLTGASGNEPGSTALGNDAGNSACSNEARNNLGNAVGTPYSTYSCAARNYKIICEFAGDTVYADIACPSAAFASAAFAASNYGNKAR